ncbi:MAG TPA: glutathione S-transferase family protein [Candidatus Binatia bacterium]
MKLHYHPNSPNCTDVLATANHLDIPLELELVDLMKGAQKEPAFLKINPNGRVPALVDGDFHLWESNAIMQYLAAKKPGNPLWPQDDKIRADIARWQFWQASQWNKAAGMLVWENMIKRFLNLGAPDPAKLKEGGELFHASAAVLDGHLSGREFLVGSQLTLADFSVAAPLIYSQPGRLPLDKYGNVRAWYGRVAALDAWKKALPKMMPG